jgi:hypothetical protein
MLAGIPSTFGSVALAAVITPAERSARTDHAFTPSSKSKAVTATAAPARARARWAPPGRAEFDPNESHRSQ